MGHTNSRNGDLLRVPLSSLLRHGRGDDIFVIVEREYHSKYGTLCVDEQSEELKEAQLMASGYETGEPMMVAVEDPKGASPMMLTKEVFFKNRKHNLAIIFNAKFAEDPEEDSQGSFCLRLSTVLDPLTKVSERIVYAPGECIEWNEEQQNYLFGLLMA